jgi:hypothetical protein
MPKAKATALRALELDESLADAHASLALIKENGSMYLTQPTDSSVGASGVS